MTHEMQLQPQYFDKMIAGQKCYEIRLWDEKRRKLSVGDRIFFSDRDNRERKVETIVTDLLYFDSFDSLLASLPLSQIGFQKETVREVKAVYRSLYEAEKEKLYGVVAVKIALL